MADEGETVFEPQSDQPLLRCRFYENVFPEPEEVVIVNVTEIGEMGAYVTLLEYDNIEGMILLSELSQKGYIDLSKRRVDPEDLAKCEERYNKAKGVHSVMRHVADQKKMALEDMYKLVGWPLYKKYKHAYDAFKMALTDSGEDIFEGAEIDIDQETKDMILSYVKRRLAPQPVKVRADIEVTCFTYEGIDAIKDALLAGEAKGSEAVPVRIKLIAPPMYVMTSMTLDKELGVETLNAAIETIKASIQAQGGSLDVKMAPKAVTLREETELQAMLDRLALEQEEVDGDAPEDA
eukprot:GSChrysophyteH1.ASY1.ANO1.334.1 assembled CDS